MIQGKTDLYSPASGLLQPRLRRSPLAGEHRSFLRVPINITLALILAAILGAPPSAAEITRETIGAWITEKAYADPPVAGTLIRIDDLDRLRPFIAPGYIEEFQFPEVSLEIQETARYQPHASYLEATERFNGQASIGADGVLQNYVAGRPFSDEQIGSAAADVAGFMVGWNQIHRWQHYGYATKEISMAFISATGGQAPAQPEEGLEGGGHVTRFLVQKYHRVYLSKLPMLADQGYRVDVPDSTKLLFKDYIEFLEPFNVKGTKFIIERSLDPYEDDQVNSYLPTERRVRRLSAKERADAFMGSDSTLDDFDGFSGRVMDYKWTYLGKRRVLDVIDSKHDAPHNFGPYSRVAHDRWQVRDCHVVELHSVWDGHPYRSRVIFIDDQSYQVAVTLIFNRDNVLWRIIDPMYKAPSFVDDAGEAIENSVYAFLGNNVIDRLGNTATVVRARTETTHPTMTPAKIKRIFSVSSLTSGQ